MHCTNCSCTLQVVTAGMRKQLVLNCNVHITQKRLMRRCAPAADRPARAGDRGNGDRPRRKASKRRTEKSAKRPCLPYQEVANERLMREDCVCLLSGSNNSSKVTLTCHSHKVLTSFAPRRPKCNQSASSSRVAKPLAAELHSFFPLPAKQTHCSSML